MKNVIEVAKAIISSSENELPFPILDSVKEYLIAWILLRNYLKVKDLDMVARVNKNHFSSIDSFKAFKLIADAINTKSVYRLYENTEMLAWRRGKLSLRESQVLVLRTTGWSLSKIAKTLNINNKSSVKIYEDRAEKKAQDGLRSIVFYLTTVGYPYQIGEAFKGIVLSIKCHQLKRDRIPKQSEILEDRLVGALESDLRQIYGYSYGQPMLYADPLDNEEEIKKQRELISKYDFDSRKIISSDYMKPLKADEKLLKDDLKKKLNALGPGSKWYWTGRPPDLIALSALVLTLHKTGHKLPIEVAAESNYESPDVLWNIYYKNKKALDLLE